MPLTHLEHFLIQTADIEKTCDWYENVLGLKRGPTPDFKFPVQWLYIGERDVLHVTQGGGATTENRKRYLGQQADAVSGSGVKVELNFANAEAIAQNIKPELMAAELPGRA